MPGRPSLPARDDGEHWRLFRLQHPVSVALQLTRANRTHKPPRLSKVEQIHAQRRRFLVQSTLDKYQRVLRRPDLLRDPASFPLLNTT